MNEVSMLVKELPISSMHNLVIQEIAGSKGDGRIAGWRGKVDNGGTGGTLGKERKAGPPNALVDGGRHVTIHRYSNLEKGFVKKNPL